MSGSGACRICEHGGARTAKALGVCVDCVRTNFPAAREYVEAAHAEARAAFDLPTKPPRDDPGIRCPLCVNHCIIGEGERGFCGLRTVRQGRLVHLAGTPQRGLLSWYRDPLPTNCVADWVCDGSQHRGSHNLAVFYESCTADCLFCQNWHFRMSSPSRSQMTSADELASVANARTFCVCFFGGDPASQMPHALAVSKRLAERGIRVCWETAGTMHPKLLDAAVRYSLDSGGCIKFDLKAFDEEVHLALTGISNRRTLENFKRVAQRCPERREPPLLVASTLLVPGYVETDQVSKIADFIASLDPAIPYSLLAFAPNFCMGDLPFTSARQAREAETAARLAGLKNVRIGNWHLLGLRLA